MNHDFLQKLTLGTAYYPEHWPESMWEQDILRMQETGITVLRIADFAWSLFEHREGEFSIDWYDPFLTLCRKHGMKVIFCTPTAAPPLWMIRKYPEVCNRDMNGNRYDGPRRHASYNVPKYRELCARLVEKLAAHYASHPEIVGWQIDNEINCDLSEFRSEADHQAFRRYLQEKFETLDCLNKSLGLTFWSRCYDDWEEVTLNQKDVGGAINPHIALEEKRFFSESAISFCKMQAEILRRYLQKNVFITTNGLFSNLDYNQLMEAGLDFITYDSYPNFAYDINHPISDAKDLRDRKWSWNLMWTRTASPLFGIMEQQSGANGWTSRMEMPMPKPGQIKLWTMQSIAHGANFVSYFRWRTSPIGCEIYWHGLNDYANTDNRRLCELREIAADVEALAPLRKAVNEAFVAIVKDYDNDWDAAGDRWHGRIDQQSDSAWFEATQRTHTPCDFLFLRTSTTLQDLGRYKLLVYPHAAIMTQAISALLKAYVKQGGTLILGARTGYKDMFGRCPVRPMPGLIADWVGLRVSDYTLVTPYDGQIMARWDDMDLAAPVFNEVLEPTCPDTKVLARYTGNYYKGEAAICQRDLGKGTVIYAGTAFSRELCARILSYTGMCSPMQDVIELPDCTELAVRKDDEHRYLFVLNYAADAANIRLVQPMFEVLTKHSISGKYTLKPYGVLCFQKPIEERQG